MPRPMVVCVLLTALVPVSPLHAAIATTTTAAAISTSAPSPVEAIAYRAVVASFLENPQQIERDLKKLTEFDLGRHSAGAPLSGCSDHLAWLWAESLATAEARLAGYHYVLQRTAIPMDPLVKTNLLAAISEAPTARIRDVRHQDRWDRWADVFNAAGYNLSRLVNGQMVGIARFFVELVYSPSQFSKVTERERKEWWLMDTYLRADPKAPDAEKLRQRMTELEARFRKDAIAKCMEMAQFYAARGWWDEALYYVIAAEKAGYTGNAKFRHQVGEQVANQQRWIERSLGVADTERFLRTDKQTRAYTALLDALTEGNREKLRKSIAVASEALANTTLADEVAEAYSVFWDWAGDRRSALEIERQMAFLYPEEQTGRAALARLDDPQYNPRTRYEEERSRFRHRQARYVLTGERTTRQNIELISEMAIPSAPALGAAAAFFVTDILVRSVLVSFGSFVPPDDLIAAGEHLLADPRNGLTPKEQSEIRIALGVFYQKLRRFEDAAAAYREARILTPELDQQMAERAADERYRRILDSEDVNSKILLLEQLTQTYPKTPTAERARDHLRILRAEAKVDFSIPYDWLAEDPVHWMKLGVRIPYELMDGSKLNGELDTRGLVFWQDFTTSATYVCSDGKKGYVNLTPQRRAILKAAAEAWADEKTALEEGEIAQTMHKVPFEIRGSAGMAGVMVYPTLQHAPLTEEDKKLFR